METPTKVQMLCPNCGSEDVTRDASCRWDAESQKWEMAGLYDGGGCNNCGADLKQFVEKDVTGTEPGNV